jgi:hypothetical protein
MAQSHRRQFPNFGRRHVSQFIRVRATSLPREQLPSRKHHSQSGCMRS